MGQHSSTLLPRVPGEVLDDIVVLAVASLGPPQELASALQSCRHVYQSINRNDVGSRIFRCKFDISAAERRFPAFSLYPSSLYKQLQSYCRTLRVVRSGDIFDRHVDDHLWNIYFMLMENDGMNAAQLIHWANVRVFIDAFVRARLHEGKDELNNWPLDNQVNALALWIMWHTSDDEEVANESLQRRSELQELVRPFVINMVRYPVFHVPDNHFLVPIDNIYMGAFPFTVNTAHGPYPPYRDAEMVVTQRIHYSSEITLMPPLISIAARLLYFGRSEAFSVVAGAHVPANRQEAQALGHDWVHPTRVDWDEFNAVNAARAPARGLLDPAAELNPTAMELHSIHFDSCFQRLIDCTDPFWVNLTAPYEFGTLTGDFSGHAQIPETSEANRMLNTPVYVEGTPSMTVTPLFIRLQEWQCVSPQVPIPEGGQGSYLWDEGLRNGWFPEVVFHINDDVIRIKDRNDASIVYSYEKFVPGHPNSHDPETCNSCTERAALQARTEEEHDQRIRSREAPWVDSFMEGENHATTSEPDPSPAQVPSTSSRVEDLPPAHDVLEPQFLKARIEEDLGGRVNIDIVLQAELADDQHTDQTTETDVDETVDNHDDDLLHDLSPFEREPCTGVRDVIVTGQTIPRHAEAWHNYVFYGRVRAYDGLIALVRKPIVFQDFGIQIFRGYLVGGTTLVGNWRSFRQNPAELAQEGPFVVRRSNFDE
ncbi:hypothetical protein EIP86_007375 [Pleurotus ostreatoroseus]|nr:hypothetical protein EIP86_007375 [Pleurotus ostreatoroseus]